MKELTHQEALQLLDIAPQAMLLLDNSGAILGFNQAFNALIGEAAGSAADITLDPGLLQPLLGTSTVVNWIMPGGDQRWLAIEIIDMPGMPGTQVRFYSDITEKLRLRHERDTLQTELAEQTLYALHNKSLLSRRGVLVSLTPLVARCRRYNSPLSLVTLAVKTDDQQRANAIADVTALLRDQTRWADLVGCNNEHEFILILQETTRDAALELVEKLAEHIERMNAGEADPFSACYGITECQKNDDADTLLERAEHALSEAASNETGRAIAL